MFQNRRSLLGTLAALVGLALTGAGEARAEFIVALGSTAANNNFLYSFDSATPGTVQGVTIGGLAAGVSIQSIDYRPANGLLYGYGSNNSIYTINAQTGAATLVTTLTGTVPTGQVSVDFNPVADRMRVVSSNGDNLRVNVDAGPTTTAIVDGTLNPPNVVATAYTITNPTQQYYLNFTATNPASAFNLSTTTNPNSGVLTSVGSTGINSAGGQVGFDISTSGVAYVAANSTGGIATLYTISLATGNVSGVLGQIDGANFTVRGLAVATGAIPEPASLAMVGVGLAAVGGLALRRRSAR